MSEASQAERERVLRGLRYCLGVFVSLRVGLSIVALVGMGLIQPLFPVGAPGWTAPPTDPGWHILITAWERFDALWFLGIATRGYVDGNGSAVFFPGYPLLIRALTPLVGGHPLGAALLVSNLSAFGSMVVFYFLTASERGEGAARKALVYLAVFPTAFFLLAPYSEAPFLLFVVISLWGARRGRWWVAGLAGAAASATRNLGVLLLVPLVVETVQQAREKEESPLPGLLWSAVVPLGALLYAWFWLELSGDALAPLHQQASWERAFAWPPVTVIRATIEAFSYPGLYPGGYHLLDWLVVVPALVAAVWAVRRLRPVYWLYVWLSLLPPLSFIFEGRPFMSLPRFAMVLFPVYWAFAAWTEGRPGRQAALVATSAGLLAVMAVMFTSWYHVF